MVGTAALIADKRYLKLMLILRLMEHSISARNVKKL
jgi:hypothetical protein